MTKKKIDIKKIIDFLTTDIWRIRLNKMSRSKSILIRHLRIILLAFRGFNEDKCQLRASALTFYSLLSIVPIVAMAFGIAKGFGFEKVLEKLLYERIPGQEEVVARIVEFAQAFLTNTKGGVIAGIGVAVLFWTVIKVLGNIESSFNDIWGIKKSRTLGRKFSDYLSIMLTCPILFIMSSSITVVITSQVQLIMNKIALLGAFSPIIFALLRLLPYCVIWIMFTFIYIFMPNNKVLFRSGLLGGIVAGTVYQVVQWIYITFQVGVSKYGAIYGSFAALPLFLVWLQVSWLVVLFGAEISFAEQNVETYEFEPDCLKASYSFKQLLTLRVANLCIKNFYQGQLPWTSDQIAQHLEIPIRLIRQILFELTEAQVLIEVRTGTAPAAYQPARDVHELTINQVINILNHRGVEDIPIAESEENTQITKCLVAFNETIEKSDANVLLKDI